MPSKASLKKSWNLKKYASKRRLNITGRNEVVAKVMFLLVSVILLTGEVSGRETPPAGRPPSGRETPPLWQGDPPLAGRHPWQGPPSRETPYQGDPRPPPAGRPPWQGDPPHPQAGRPPWQGDPPDKETPPAGRPRPSIRSMSGRYASCWNAFSFLE